jgi:hypothetical protein
VIVKVQADIEIETEDGRRRHRLDVEVKDDIVDWRRKAVTAEGHLDQEADSVNMKMNPSCRRTYPPMPADVSVEPLTEEAAHVGTYTGVSSPLHCDSAYP